MSTNEDDFSEDELRPSKDRLIDHPWLWWSFVLKLGFGWREDAKAIADFCASTAHGLGTSGPSSQPISSARVGAVRCIDWAIALRAGWVLAPWGALAFICGISVFVVSRIFCGNIEAAARCSETVSETELHPPFLEAVEIFDAPENIEPFRAGLRIYRISMASKFILRGWLGDALGYCDTWSQYDVAHTGARQFLEGFEFGIAMESVAQHIFHAPGRQMSDITELDIAGDQIIVNAAYAMIGSNVAGVSRNVSALQNSGISAPWRPTCASTIVNLAIQTVATAVASAARKVKSVKVSLSAAKPTLYVAQSYLLPSAACLHISRSIGKPDAAHHQNRIVRTAPPRIHGISRRGTRNSNPKSPLRTLRHIYPMAHSRRTGH